jgi:recombination protein RecR
MLLPEPIQNLVNAFSRLPGIGPKTASRLTFYLLRAPEDVSRDLAEALFQLKAGTTYCRTCFNITTAGRIDCEICSNDGRDFRQVCVVMSRWMSLRWSAPAVFGRYQAPRRLSPIEGIAEQLRIRELVERVRAGGIQEIIWDEPQPGRIIRGLPAPAVAAFA